MNYIVTDKIASIFFKLFNSQIDQIYLKNATN